MNHWRNTSDSLAEGTSKLRGYRSRYQAFLQQKTQKPAAQIHNQIQKISNFGQGVMSVATFVGLFIAILTIFGMGLSWYSRNHAPVGAVSQSGESPEAGDAGAASALAERSPTPTAEPTGRADVKKKTRR